MRILKLNTPEWPYIFFGSFAAIINGLLPLAFALLLSELLTVSEDGYFLSWIDLLKSEMSPVSSPNPQPAPVGGGGGGGGGGG